MQKEKRKQSKDEENDSSSRKRRKADLSKPVTNCVDFRGLSALEFLDLDGNKFSSLPSGIGFLPKLEFLSVQACKYLVSIPDLPSSLDCLGAAYCKSLKRVRITIEPKKELHIELDNSHLLEEIQGIEGLSNSFWYIRVDEDSHSPNKFSKSIVEAMCNGRHPYLIECIPGEMPKWLSYRGEGCSLSFHIPPVFHGLVLWFVCPLDHDYSRSRIIIIIRNKSNGIQLFECQQWYPPETLSPRTEGWISGWIRHISRSEMAMEDYCGDDELELYISSEPPENAVHIIKECGVHVIAGKSDSFEESEVGRNTMMHSPPSYYLLSHPHCGSITASTPKQWSDYLFAKLQGHSLSLTLDGKRRDNRK